MNHTEINMFELFGKSFTFPAAFRFSMVNTASGHWLAGNSIPIIAGHRIALYWRFCCLWSIWQRLFLFEFGAVGSQSLKAFQCISAMISLKMISLLRMGLRPLVIGYVVLTAEKLSNSLLKACPFVDESRLLVITGVLSAAWQMSSDFLTMKCCGLERWPPSPCLLVWCLYWNVVFW